jgi:hypothetical protein
LPGDLVGLAIILVGIAAALFVDVAQRGIRAGELLLRGLIVGTSCGPLLAVLERFAGGACGLFAFS